MSWIHIEGTIYGRPAEENPVEVVDLVELYAKKDNLISEINKLESTKKPTTDKDADDKEAIEFWNEKNVDDHLVGMKDKLKKLNAKIDDILNGN